MAESSVPNDGTTNNIRAMAEGSESAQGLQQDTMLANIHMALHVATISVGMHNGTPVLDLPYEEDSKAEVDMNVVMLQPINGGEPTYVEVQGTAEGKAFSRSELDSLLGLAAGGLEQIFAKQREVIATPPTPRPLGR
jgi:ribonuclease PH